MLPEELRDLPTGSQVIGQIEITKRISGVVEAMKDGPRFIRWADGYVTFPFGWVPAYDEYIAAHTEVQPSRYTRFHLGTATRERTVSVEEEQAISV